MFQSHKEMLKPVLETIQSTETLVPLGDHSTLQKTWNEEQQNILVTTIRACENEEIIDAATRLLDLATDAYSLFLKHAGNPSWQTLSAEERLRKVAHLKTVPQIEQRTGEWYKHAAKVLTASEFSGLFGSHKARRALILSKAFPKTEERAFNRLACPTAEMNPMGWGIRFEPIVKLILEQIHKCKIYEAGRITHTENGMLAASPDGIIEDSADPKQIGRLLEIKCPYTRQIGGEIPFDYWIQMQIQMEVCNLDECEYVETELLSPRAGVETVDLTECTVKGIVYLLKEDVEEGMPFHYRYLYGDIGSSKCPDVPNGYIVVETIPWGLKRWYQKLVSRDRGWYTATLPWQAAFWSDVALAKEGKPYSVQISEEPQKKDICLISD